MPKIDEIRRILRENQHTWLRGTHQGNDGNQGNTLEKLLGVSENNLRIPDLGDIELKSQKNEGGSLITLFHREPKPRASLPKLLKALGWRHSEAGARYPDDEMSFRSTTFAHRHSDRGFSIELAADRIELRFDPLRVSADKKDSTDVYETYVHWLNDVELRRPHYSDILPVFWDRNVFEAECKKKIDNTLMCYMDRRVIHGVEEFRIAEVHIYKNFLSSRMADLFSLGAVAIDFDARTGHNHGTKLRVKRSALSMLFDYSEQII